MNPVLKGFLRGLMGSVITLILTYVGTKVGASGLVSAPIAMVIAGAAVSLEHYLTEVDPTDFPPTATAPQA